MALFLHRSPATSLYFRVAAMGALLIGMAYCKQNPPVIQAPPPGEVWLTQTEVEKAHLEIKPLRRQKVQERLMLSGKIAFDDTRVTHVFSPVSGRIQKILVEPGEKVHLHSPLVILDAPEVGLVTSDVKKAIADLMAATHELQRQKELAASGASAQREYENAQDRFGQAQAELQRARQKAKLFQQGTVNKVTQTYELQSQLEGDVIVRSVSPGMEIQGSYGGGTPQELFTIGQLDRVWLLADVFESDLSRIHKGAQVEVTVIAYPEKKFVGQIDWVADTLDPTTHTAKIRCTLENVERLLRPEMYATVAVVSGTQQKIAIPRSALLRSGEQTLLFIEQGTTRDGRIRFVRFPIAVDESQTTDFVPIPPLLAEGTRVVVSGAILLLGVGEEQ